MFSITKKSYNALADARNRGLNRFTVTPQTLTYGYFDMALTDVVDEESFVDNKNLTLANRKVSGDRVGAVRFARIGEELLEAEFCLGIFALASEEPSLYHVNEDTTTRDVYGQVLENYANLSREQKAAVEKAAKAIVGNTGDGGFDLTIVTGAVVGITKGLYSTGVVASRLTRKGLNKTFGFLAKITADKPQK